MGSFSSFLGKRLFINHPFLSAVSYVMLALSAVCNGSAFHVRAAYEHVGDIGAYSITHYEQPSFGFQHTICASAIIACFLR